MVISAACAGLLLHTASAAMRARRTTFVRSMTSSRCFWCYLLYEIRLINLLAGGDSVSLCQRSKWHRLQPGSVTIKNFVFSLSILVVAGSRGSRIGALLR